MLPISTVRQGWKPESGFLHYGWGGYDEAIILYVLGLASPTHPFPESSYTKWTATYQWENIYDYELLYAGPLFIHLFSQAWMPRPRQPSRRDCCDSIFRREPTCRCTHKLICTKWRVS